MDRRTFLKTLGITVSLPVTAQEGPPEPGQVEKLVAGSKPGLVLNHLGFLPRSKKVVIFRFSGGTPPSEFFLEDIAGPNPPFRIQRPLQRTNSDFGAHMTGNFSDIERTGMFQVTVGDERSVPFFIRPDVWRRTLPKAFSFYPQQRCGIAISNVHPVSIGPLTMVGISGPSQRWKRPERLAPFPFCVINKQITSKGGVGNEWDY